MKQRFQKMNEHILPLDDLSEQVMAKATGKKRGWSLRPLAAVAAVLALLILLIILLVVALLPEPYGISLPAGPQAFIMFLVSMVLGLLVLVAFNMLVYISAFYTISPMGIRILVTSVLEFLAGAVVPIPFFPDWLQPIMYALPFGSIQSTPFLIYVGHLEAAAGMGAIALQAAWLLALVIIGRLMMRQELQSAKKCVVRFVD